MAVREIRVCELTDEPGAVIVPISVGSRRWHVDLSDNGLKLLLELLLPVTSKGILVSLEGDDDPTVDEPDTQPDPTPPGSDEDDSPKLTAEERAAARAWGRKTANWRRCGLTGPPGDRGTLHGALIEGWIRAGRPVPMG